MTAFLPAAYCSGYGRLERKDYVHPPMMPLHWTLPIWGYQQGTNIHVFFGDSQLHGRGEFSAGGRLLSASRAAGCTAFAAVCGVIAGVGFLYGASLFVPFLLNEGWVRVMVLDHSISYRVTLVYQDVLAREWIHGLYALCVISPLLLQSDFHVRVFGGVVLMSMLIASQEFAQAYISVWCFFAAVASAYLFFMLPQHGRVAAVNPS